MTKLTEQQISTALELAFAEAARVTREYLNEHGTADACGFAWCNVKPGNSPVAKMLKAKYGARRPYGGTGVDVWNPSGNYTQCITAKEEGARAWAKVVKQQLGVDVTVGSRLD